MELVAIGVLVLRGLARPNINAPNLTALQEPDQRCDLRCYPFDERPTIGGEHKYGYLPVFHILLVWDALVAGNQHLKSFPFRDVEKEPILKALPSQLACSYHLMGSQPES
jgi:hypothetical protein